MQVVTVAERKAAETARKTSAAGTIVERLRGYARAEGGRFVVFGSFAVGRMRHDSDLDILIDFAPAKTADAWRFAEDLCTDFDIAADIKDVRDTRPDFVAQVTRSGLVLP